jgi:hypothetical protein
MLDGLVFQAEAEVRWLDMCQARLAREHTAAGRPPRRAGTAEPAVERSS